MEKKYETRCGWCNSINDIDKDVCKLDENNNITNLTCPSCFKIGLIALCEFEIGEQ